MLTKQTPDSLKAQLTIKAQGVENTLLLTYHNVKPDDFDAFRKNPESLKVPADLESDKGAAITFINAQFVLFVVKSFDDGTDAEFPLTLAGLTELDRYWPGVLRGIVDAYHQARAAAVEKN